MTLLLVGTGFGLSRFRPQTPRRRQTPPATPGRAPSSPPVPPFPACPLAWGPIGSGGRLSRAEGGHPATGRRPTRGSRAPGHDRHERGGRGGPAAATLARGRHRCTPRAGGQAGPGPAPRDAAPTTERRQHPQDKQPSAPGQRRQRPSARGPGNDAPTDRKKAAPRHGSQAGTTPPRPGERTPLPLVSIARIIRSWGAVSSPGTRDAHDQRDGRLASGASEPHAPAPGAENRPHWRIPTYHSPARGTPGGTNENRAGWAHRRRTNGTFRAPAGEPKHRNRKRRWAHFTRKDWAFETAPQLPRGSGSQTSTSIRQSACGAGTPTSAPRQPATIATKAGAGPDGALGRRRGPRRDITVPLQFPYNSPIS